MNLFYHQVDRSDDAGALCHLENALASSGKSGSVVRHALFSEAAFLNARLRHNPAAARTWRDRAVAINKSAPLHVVDAAIATEEGRYQAALISWKSAHSCMNKVGVESGLATFAKEKWAEYEAICRAHLGGL